MRDVQGRHPDLENPVKALPSDEDAHACKKAPWAGWRGLHFLLTPGISD
jgi:hypothetical protein